MVALHLSLQAISRAEILSTAASAALQPSPPYAGSAVAFALTSPRGVCVGASGAVFGLYVVALGVLLANFSFRKLLEVVAITPFVVGQITSNVAAQVTGGSAGPLGMNIAYMGHLGGALAGLALVLLNFSLPKDR